MLTGTQEIKFGQKIHDQPVLCSQLELVHAIGMAEN